MKSAQRNKGSLESGSPRDLALVGALVGAGLCVPALIAASQFIPLHVLEALGLLVGGSTIGCGFAAISARRKKSLVEARTLNQTELQQNLQLPPMRPATELVLRHDANGDVLQHSGSNHTELGKLADTVFGKGLLNLIRITDRPAYLKAISDAHHGKAAKAIHLHIAVSTTPRIYQAFSFTARPTPNGCESVLRDISNELELLKSLQDLPSVDDAENQLAKVASHMAHELRSPLNSILGFSEMLAGDSSDRFTEEQRKEYAGLIHQSGTHLLGVVDNMLDIGQLKAGRLELSENLFDVGLLCHESVSILEPQIQESALKIDIVYPHDLPLLYADEKCCRQMLINLIGNAIKFTSGVGEVSLTARHVKSHIEFEVKDSGVGIPDEALARLGRPFERVEGTNVPGTGLGLSLVRQMVELHGGTFKLESVLGEGTTATLSLPVVRAGVGDTCARWPAKDTRHTDKTSIDLSDDKRRIA